MEEATVHAVDGMAVSNPEYLLVLAILIIIAATIIKVIPIWRDLKQSEIDNEAKYRQSQIDIERDRELRKMEESKQRFEREKETAEILSRSVDAQERSTIAINESTAQMAILAAKLEISQQGSMSMRDTMDDMATEVHDIHLAVVHPHN